jgi:hypothetical protein
MFPNGLAIASVLSFYRLQKCEPLWAAALLHLLMALGWLLVSINQ